MTRIETALPRATFIAALLCLCLSGPVSAATYSWTSGGPYGGNTLSLAISPDFASDQTVFAGNYSGVFKSTDGGATWTGPGTGSIISPGNYVCSIAVSPNYSSDRTVFAGILRSDTYDGYVMKSTDGGSTWSTVDIIVSSTIYPIPIEATIFTIAFSPSYASDQTVFVCSAGGFRKTTNGGTSWADVNNGLENNYKTFDTLAVSPDFSSDHTAFAGSLSYGVYKTTNGGTHWSSVGTVPNSQYIRAVALSPGFASDNTLFAGTLAGVYISTDGGANWSDISGGLTSTRVTALVVSPAYATDETLFAATEDGLFKKSGSSGWAPLDLGNTNRRFNALAVSPGYSSDGVVFAAKDDGVFKSSDGGGSWSAANGQISDMPVYALGVSPSYSTDSTILAGTWGAGVFRTTDSGATWAPVNTGLTNFYVLALGLSPGFSSDQTAFAGTRNGRIFKTTDGGNNWTEVYAGADTSNIMAIVLSPGYTADNTLFSCSWGEGIKKSTDSGASWASANTGLPGYASYTINISPDYASDHTLFVGGADGPYKSTDGGANWSLCSTGISSPQVNAFGISKTFSSDHTVFAATWGGGVSMSTDGGSSWSAATSGVGSVNTYSMALSPNYAATQLVSAGTWVYGVYRTNNGGTSWSEYNSGIGNKNIAVLYDTGQTLFAATEGGVWGAPSTGIDFMPPVTTLTAPENYAMFTTSFTVSGATLDPESGVAKVEVSINSGPWTAATDTSGNGTWSSWSYGYRPPMTGNYTIQARGTDRVGNVETPKPAITVYVSALGTPELQHDNWSPVLSGGSCTFCHTTPSRFLPARFRQDAPVFCFSCHNQAGVGHDSCVMRGQGHSSYTSINLTRDKMPTYGNITASQRNNQQFSRLMPVNIMTCNTCHNIMTKTEDFSRVWDKTTTTDYKVYKLQNGGWAGMGYQKINVYRDTTLWASSPTYSRDKKNYLVSPSEYKYDEKAGTVTFKAAQSTLLYIYVTLDYPYTRAGAQDNRQCSDCHAQGTHLGANCLACHEAHNTANVKDIRQSVRATGMTSIPVKFLKYTGANSFADGDATHDGICEVCHTQTRYYRRDGTGFANHSGGYNYDGKACTGCHGHANGFAK